MDLEDIALGCIIGLAILKVITTIGGLFHD